MPVPRFSQSYDGEPHYPPYATSFTSQILEKEDVSLFLSFLLFFFSSAPHKTVKFYGWFLVSDQILLKLITVPSGSAVLCVKGNQQMLAC